MTISIRKEYWRFIRQALSAPLTHTHTNTHTLAHARSPAVIPAAWCRQTWLTGKLTPAAVWMDLRLWVCRWGGGDRSPAVSLWRQSRQKTTAVIMWERDRRRRRLIEDCLPPLLFFERLICPLWCHIGHWDLSQVSDNAPGQVLALPLGYLLHLWRLDQSCPAHCHIITSRSYWLHRGHVSHTTQSNSAAVIEEKRAKTQSRLKTGSMLLLLLRRYKDNHPRIGIMSFSNQRLQWIWIMPWISVVIIGLAFFFWWFPTFHTGYFSFAQHFPATAFRCLHHINCEKCWNVTARKV